MQKTENQNILYIYKPLDVNDLNLMLNESQNQYIELLVVDTLYDTLDNFYKINFPFTLKGILLTIHIEDLKCIGDSEHIGEFIHSKFKIPFDCDLTIRLNQVLYDDDNYYTETHIYKFYDYVIKNGKIICDRNKPQIETDIYKNTSNIFNNLVNVGIVKPTI